jgi:hypothetical protein
MERTYHSEEGIAEIADIAVIAGDRKGKPRPRINADERGSRNQNLTAETRRKSMPIPEDIRETLRLAVERA